MSSTERLTALDRAQLLTKAFTDAQVRIVVELGGRVDEGRLAEAVRLAVAAEPVLACRVQDRFFRPRWTPLRGVRPESLLRVVATDDPAAATHRLIVEDLDPRTGPIVRVAVVRAERDTIVINLDHTAGDGASIRLLAYLLASAYTRPDRVAAADVRRAFAKRRFEPLRPFLREGGKRLRAKMPSRDREPSWQFPWGTAARERSKRLVVRRIDGARAAAVHEFAAAQGAWTNDVFLAAYLRAFDRVAGERSGAPRLTVPVDLRGYLAARERPRVANLASAYEMEPGRALGQSLRDTLAKVRSATQAKRNSRPGLAEAAFITSIMNHLPQRILESRFNSGKIGAAALAPWFIDLGVLRPDKLSFGCVAARHAYSLQSFGRTDAMFQIGLSTFRGSITIAVCFQGDAAQEPLVNAFLDRFEAELPG